MSIWSWESSFCNYFLKLSFFILNFRLDLWGVFQFQNILLNFLLTSNFMSGVSWSNLCAKNTDENSASVAKVIICFARVIFAFIFETLQDPLFLPLILIRIATGFWEIRLPSSFIFEALDDLKSIAIRL